MRSLSPALQQFLQECERRQLGPEQVASALLQRHKGDPRAAEVEAWDIFDYVAGGSPGMRPNSATQNSSVSSINEVIRCILDGTEEPKVERTPVRHFSRNAGRGGILSSLVGR